MVNPGAETLGSPRSGAGRVRATVERTTSCGRSSPAFAAKYVDHAPPASTTRSARTGPRSVCTPRTWPLAVSTVRTAQCSVTDTPAPRAARASAGTATNGSARPSLGVSMPPTHCPSTPGAVARASSAESMRVSSWCSFARSCHCANLARARSSSARYTQPAAVNSRSCSPVSPASPRQIRFDSIMIGSSSRSRPCWRTQPQLRLDCSPATLPFSISATFAPCRARNQAVDVPTTPAPITATSTASGSGSENVIGVDSEIIGMEIPPRKYSV